MFFDICVVLMLCMFEVNGVVKDNFQPLGLTIKLYCIVSADMNFQWIPDSLRWPTIMLGLVLFCETASACSGLG